MRRLIAIGYCRAPARRRTRRDTSSEATRRTNLDQILDLYVRDGSVYYRALKSDRRRWMPMSLAIDASIASASRERKSRSGPMLQRTGTRTVIDHYPSLGARTSTRPQHQADSGAFERLQAPSGRKEPHARSD